MQNYTEIHAHTTHAEIDAIVIILRLGKDRESQLRIEFGPSSFSSSVESHIALAVCSPLRSLALDSSPSLAASVSSELRLGLSPKSFIS